jgi:hypothetical protein
MAIKDAIKNVADKAAGALKKMADTVKETAQGNSDLAMWKEKLEVARAEFNIDLMDEREYLYLGTRGVDANINSKQMPSKYANNVYNIIYEFIETQVNNQIPQPSVRSVRPEFEEQARDIEDSIANKLKQMDTEEVTDANERITPVQGYSIMELCWNNDIKHHLYTGDMELYSRHPKQLITQPGVFRLKNMDYFFVLSKVTPDYVKRRYGVDLSNQAEQYPDNTGLPGVTKSSQLVADHTLTEIVAWYRDEDGDIGKFTWINDTVLEDLPKYYYRRDENGNPIDTEIITQDITIGEIDPTTGQNVVIPAGTEVPYFIPKCYPFVIRRNVPKNFDFGGQSDVDVVRDQQDSIKKVVTKMEEKLIKGGSAIVHDENMNVTITDQVYQVIKGSTSQIASLKTIDLTADISKDLQYIQMQYKIAQSMLGITDSFQGKEDDTAKSGVAKQIQVQQASGRLQSKQFNKNAAYKELFELMFYFKLAFYDEPRPYITTDEYGKPQYKEFDRYKFLLRDADGQLYYNTDFLFSADVGSGLPKDSIFMYNQVTQMFQMQAIDKLQYWTILEYLNFPMAKQIKSQIEQQQQLEAQMQQMQQMQAQAAAQ